MKWAAVLVGALCLYCGYSQERVNLTESTALIDDLRSLDTPDSVRSSPRLRGHEWKIRQQSHARSRSNDDDLDELVVLISGYTSNGITGDLMLQFYNHQLMATTFYPSDFDQFARVLDKMPLQTDELGRPQYRVPNSFTLITVGADVSGRKFVSWEDTRLTAKVERWISRNS